MKEFILKIITLCIVVLAFPQSVSASPLIQTNDTIPIIHSTIGSVSIREGNEANLRPWGLVPEAKPDILEIALYNTKPRRVVFYTDLDSIQFMVERGKSYDFSIQWGEKQCYQRIVGKTFIPAANYSSSFQLEHKGKIDIAIPEVYELVNIAMAITSYGLQNKNRIYQRSLYYQKVQQWFGIYKNLKFAVLLDSILTWNDFHYANVKMNANAFVFDDKGEVQRSTVYDRTGFRYQKSNFLVPYLELMQEFARKTEFLKFYEENKEFYEGQVGVYRDSIGIPEMQVWLDKNFPGSNGFDYYNIVFSPLVSWHQSSTWFENNGFKELQPHVNFPYRQDLKKLLPLSKTAEYIYRGNIAFTEINHGYINPLAEKYIETITEAIKNRELWVESRFGGNYYSGNALFNEYMNWGLISLRIMDYVHPTEQEKLIQSVEHMMTKNRGFLKFRGFNQFLMSVYKNRSDKTIADLYPDIITWFTSHN